MCIGCLLEAVRPSLRQSIYFFFFILNSKEEKLLNEINKLRRVKQQCESSLNRIIKFYKKKLEIIFDVYWQIFHITQL